MTDLASGDVTYTENFSAYIPHVGIRRQMTLSFGDGALTYPSGGIPLTNAGLGMKNGVIRAFRILEPNAADGIVYEWDKSANTLRMYNSATSSGTNSSDSAGTPAGTNATSLVAPKFEPDRNLIVKPVIALTHNADPVVNLAAAALYAYEAQGQGIENLIYLESTTNGNADILGETANGTVGLIAASCRFLVTDNDTPNGVQIYVAEDTSDQLEFISPTGADGYIVMPFEAAAGAPGGCAVAVKVHHAADADGGKPLYFDDNGAADAQLAFVDTGASGGTIPAADIIPLVPAYMQSEASPLGQAAAQTFTGSALGTHTHTLTGGGSAGLAELSGAVTATTVEIEVEGY